MNLTSLFLDLHTGARTAVTVYFNQARDAEGRSRAWVRGYLPGDPLEVAFQVPLLDEEQSLPAEVVAEKMFELLNIGHEPEMVRRPDERAVAYRLAARRSLSVGDVLQVGDAFLAVARCGFTKVDEPAQAALTSL